MTYPELPGVTFPYVESTRPTTNSNQFVQSMQPRMNSNQLVQSTQPRMNSNQLVQSTQPTTNLNESLNITDIDFSKVKYFKKVDHDGNIIQYSKNFIVAYNDRLYYASEDVSGSYEPFEKSAVWNELRNIPNRRVQSITKPTGYLRSGDRWFNTITNKEYVFQNIKNNPHWISH